MKIINEYKIAYASNIKKLEIEVNELIKQGFQPYGSAQVILDDVQGLMVQPMVYYGSEEQ